MCIAKVIIVKQSVKICHYGINSAVWMRMYPVVVVCVERTILCMLHCTHTMCVSNFNINFNVSFKIPLEQSNCAFSWINKKLNGCIISCLCLNGISFYS